MAKIACLNCEEMFPKYMTQVVSLETFPSLEEKAQKYDHPQIRVCEDCYDELAANLNVGSSSHLHPYFQASSEQDESDVASQR